MVFYHSYASPCSKEIEYSNFNSSVQFNFLKTLSIAFKQDVFILFDPGSTHSYVSTSIIDCIAVPCVKMDFEVLVTNPLGQEVRVDRMYRDCPLVIQGDTFLSDLIEMPFKDYDIILGMDWLARHHTIIDCRLKTVTFGLHQYSDEVIHRER